MSDNNRTTATLEEITSKVGEEIGHSRWYEMSQSRVDTFADCTEDWYFIHTNPEKAKEETPWGGTIAHGFLTASMLSAMAYDVLPRIEGAVRGVNYGFDKLRFVSPVPVGSRIRGRFTLSEAVTEKPDEITLKYATIVEVEGADRPALAAEWLTRQFFH